MYRNQRSNSNTDFGLWRTICQRMLQPTFGKRNKHRIPFVKLKGERLGCDAIAVWVLRNRADGEEA